MMYTYFRLGQVEIKLDLPNRVLKRGKDSALQDKTPPNSALQGLERG